MGAVGARVGGTWAGGGEKIRKRAAKLCFFFAGDQTSVYKLECMFNAYKDHWCLGDLERELKV